MNLSFFPRALFPLAGGLKPLVFSSCLHVGGAGRRSRVREFANGATCRTRREDVLPLCNLSQGLRFILGLL